MISVALFTSLLRFIYSKDNLRDVFLCWLRGFPGRFNLRQPWWFWWRKSKSHLTRGNSTSLPSSDSSTLGAKNNHENSGFRKRPPVFLVSVVQCKEQGHGPKTSDSLSLRVFYQHQKRFMSPKNHNTSCSVALLKRCGLLTALILYWTEIEDLFNQSQRARRIERGSRLTLWFPESNRNYIIVILLSESVDQTTTDEKTTEHHFHVALVMFIRQKLFLDFKFFHSNVLMVSNQLSAHNEPRRLHFAPLIWFFGLCKLSLCGNSNAKL